jgi:hypothetical protein
MAFFGTTPTNIEGKTAEIPPQFAPAGHKSWSAAALRYWTDAHTRPAAAP